MSSSPRVTDEISEVFAKTVAAEYAYFTPKGAPLCWPVTPYWYPDRGVLAIATGVAYPRKADYAKLHPKVAMLFSDPTSSGLEDPPMVLVQGQATVLEDDIQANTDRYVTEMRDRFAAARIALNPMTVKLLDFYLPRLWVEIEPVRIKVAPRSKGTPGPPSQRPSAMQGPTLTAREASEVTKRVNEHGEGVVTVRGTDGFPHMLRTLTYALADGSVLLADSPGTGPAALTLHHHTLGGTRFKAYMVRGTIAPGADGHRLVPSRIVGFFGNGGVFPLSAIRSAASLRRNLRRELERREQPMPDLRVPRRL